jgi:lysozyme family protein
VKPGATAADIKAMRLDDAETIYRNAYWNVLRCDELPAGLDYAVFDYGVNSGVSRAAKVLQRLLGLTDDGGVTDAVLAAVRKGNAADLAARLCDERLAFLKQLKTWPVFGTGWTRRVAEVRTAALAMASAPAPASLGTAPHAVAGVVVVAGAAAAQQAHQSGARPEIIVAIVVAAIALAVAGWLAWRWWQGRPQNQPITGEQP